MLIYLRAGGQLRDLLRPDIDSYTKQIEVPEGLTIREIVNTIGIQPELIAFAHTKGTIKKLDYIPSEGEVILFNLLSRGGDDSRKGLLEDGREFPASLRSGKKFAGGEAKGQMFPKPAACSGAGSQRLIKIFVGASSSRIVDKDANLVIPWHPVAGVFDDREGMYLEGHQVVERINIPQVAGVNQAHEHITDECAILGFVKQTIFSIMPRLELC